MACLWLLRHAIVLLLGSRGGLLFHSSRSKVPLGRAARGSLALGSAGMPSSSSSSFLASFFFSGSFFLAGSALGLASLAFLLSPLPENSANFLASNWASLAQRVVVPSTALQWGWLTTVVNHRVTLPKSALRDGTSSCL